VTAARPAFSSLFRIVLVMLPHLGDSGSWQAAAGGMLGLAFRSPSGTIHAGARLSSWPRCAFVMSHIEQQNAFLEDTCVLVTLAYLLSRGALLPRIFDRRRRRWDQVALALVFCLIGASDLLFPGDRRPYVPATLATTFAGYAGGADLGLLTAAMMALVFTVVRLIQGVPAHFLVYDAVVFSTALAGALVAWLWALQGRKPGLISMLTGALVAGAISEFLHTGWRSFYASTPPALLAASAGANGFGCALLTLVLLDAADRREAARIHLQDEQELAALRLSQLGELQARLHPHFLFNALAAIAGLCVVRPDEAEGAVTTLASLLRRFLQSPSEICVPLREELATVRAYLTIEGLRLGDRLFVTEDIPDALLSIPVPRFCLQTVVENAVQHGIAPSGRRGHVQIVVRRSRRPFLLLAVADNGDGLSVPLKLREFEKDTATHGLSLVSIRLQLACRFRRHKGDIWTIPLKIVWRTPALWLSMTNRCRAPT
jgi:LytS/YehU family sensor histidine kinase